MNPELNNNNEQINIDPSIKQEQIDRDFDAVLKEFMDMDNKEQAEFIESIANKDPHFNELYTQLKSFFQDRIMNLEDYDSHLKLEAVKKHIQSSELDNSKNESIRLEPNITDFENLKAIFYRIAPDGELHSKYFTVNSPENQKIATINAEFTAWLDRARSYIDNKYKAPEKDEIEEVNVDNQDANTQTENIESQESITLSDEQAQEAYEKGNEKIQEFNEKQEKIKSKTLQLNLVGDVSQMYRSYLESILSNIKLKFVSDKDEGYEVQINTIETELRNTNNLIQYIDVLGNSDELINFDTKQLLDKLIVSEEKLAENMGYFDQPISFLWNKDHRISTVNNGYEEIKNILSSDNITAGEVENIKISIFNQIRGYDSNGLDDDKHRYNTSEGIRTQISDNILNNYELNKDSQINSSFELIKSFNSEQKDKLYDALKGGKPGLDQFFKDVGIYKNLGTQNIDEKSDFLDDTFDALHEGLDKIEDSKLTDVIKKEINTKISYLEKNINDTNREKTNEAINILKTSISEKKLELSLKQIKTETIFKSLERIVISQTLNNNSQLVEQIGKTDTGVELYRDIEGIGGKMSDRMFNKISSGTQFLAEQIALMFISGGLGGLAIKGLSKIGTLGQTSNILKGGFNAANIGKLSTLTVAEGMTFYTAYSALNGAMNNKEFGDFMEQMNTYDAFRTVVFLGVLRSFGNTGEKLNFKNIALDTRNILGTDLLIRSTIGDYLGKESIDGFSFKDLKATDVEKIGDFMVKELSFILPLVIGLRMSDKAVATAFVNKENPKVEIKPTETEYIIRIEGLQKEIRISKQQRNILRKKGKDTNEINAVISEKKNEYKNLRDNKQEFLEPTTNKVIQENLINTNQKDAGTKSKQKDNVNTETGIPLKYRNLEKFSQEAQKGKIDYVLKDEIIGGKIMENGIGKNGENVGKGLLEKSGFKRGEKPEPKNKFEKNAVKEMKEANRIVYKDFTDIEIAFYSKSIKEAFIVMESKGIKDSKMQKQIIGILMK